MPLTIALGLVPWLLLQAPAADVREETKPAVPDVIVLVLDDVSWYETVEIPLPHLDRLKARGVSFTRAYANPVCWETRLSLVFGKSGGHPGETCGKHDARDYPEPGTLSVPRLLAGHRSTFLGKWHLGSDASGNWPLAPIQHGFERTFALSPTNLTDSSCGSPGLFGELSYSRWMRSDAGGTPYLSTQYHTEAVLEGALAALGEPVERPKLVWVALQAAHSPYHRPPAALLPKDAQVGRGIRGRYQAMVRSADEVLGRLLERVDLERTLVVVVGDNGTPRPVLPQDWPEGHGKQTTYERGIRVPLVVGGACVDRRGESDVLVHAQDLLATLAELLALPLPPGAVPGTYSFAGALREGTPGHPRPHVRTGMDDKVESWSDHAVIEARWKLRRHTRPDGSVVEELFDLEQDPLETADRSHDPERADVLARLRAVLDS